MKEDRATLARVNHSEHGSLGVVGSSQRQDISVCSPYGVHSLPCTGDRAMLVTAEGTPILLGVVGSAPSLNPGEVLLQSNGGATIYLKNNGDIILNGLTITKQGAIINP